ncbi:MAG: hypothetical protein AOA65_1896 [Candidatus Bathyarchaeota archaeon BA1]|nr:MAG: hypothetical protein AOA65_1896 [Candidatus Bathyarchaeota archaeon BA1]
MRALTAYTELSRGQRVTIARMGRGLKEILIMSGKIIDQKYGYDCRNTVFIKVNDVSAFLRNTSSEILWQPPPRLWRCVVPLINLCQILGVRAIKI